jgi:hypothetical protein
VYNYLKHSLAATVEAKILCRRLKMPKNQELSPVRKTSKWVNADGVSKNQFLDAKHQVKN